MPRKIFILLIVFMSAGVSIYAADFCGLTPGKSTLKDVDKALGKPSAEIISGRRYEYLSKDKEYKRILITIDEDTNIIEAVNVFLAEEKKKDELLKRYRLKEPVKISNDIDDKRIEYYQPQAIALHYSGKDAQSSVVMLRYFNPQMLIKEKSGPKEETASAQKVEAAKLPGVITYTPEVMKEIGHETSVEKKAEPIKVQPIRQPAQSISSLPQVPQPQPQKETKPIPEKKAYLGVQIQKYDGEGIKIIRVTPESPAYFAGLQSGDIILEMENRQFYQTAIEPQKFVETIANMPTIKPLRFFIERDTKRFDAWIKLKEIDVQQTAIPTQLQRQFPATPQLPIDNFAKGMELVQQKNYSAAVDHFNKTVGSKPRESYEMLGVCYHHLNRMNEALDYLSKSYKMDDKAPVTVFYLALYNDKIGKAPHAQHYLRRYLSLKHDNASMNDYAKKRLGELDYGFGRKMGEGLFKIFQETTKE